MKKIICLIVLFISTPSYAFDIDPQTVMDGMDVSISTGYIYSAWEPTDIDGADYKTTGLNVAYVELKSSFGKFRYEITPGSKADQDRILEKEKSGEKIQAAWEKFLAWVKLGPLPVIVSYNRTVFLTDLTLEENKLYFPFDEGEDAEGITLLAGETLSSMTIFEEYSILWLWEQQNGFNLWLGGYYKEYQKPYSFTINEFQLSEFIFDAKFTSTGIRGGMGTNEGRGFYPIFSVELFAGPGDIEFVESVVLTDIIPEETSILFVEGVLELGLGFRDEYFSFKAAVNYRKTEYSLEDESSSATGEEFTLNEDQILRVELALSYFF